MEARESEAVLNDSLASPRVLLLPAECPWLCGGLLFLSALSESPCIFFAWAVV